MINLYFFFFNLEDKQSVQSYKLRSTFCGQLMDQTHHILLWRSTSVGRWKGKQGWILQSRQSISLWGSNDLDLHGRWSKSSQFLLHSVSNSWEHRGTSGKDDVSVEIFTDINITLHDGVVGSLMDTSSFHSEEGWLEEGFRASESLITDGDDLTVRKFIGLLEGRRGGGSLHFLFEIKGNI